MHVDLTDLRLMVAIAEANSLSKGADRSHLSVAAVSVRIKNIEESLGTRLLYRSSQGVTLTPPGQALVQHARLVLAQMERLRSDLQAYTRGVKGHLRVYASITAIAEFLPPTLGRYLASHPDVNIDLRERPSSDIVRAVSEGQADLGIISGPVRTEALELRPYRTDRLVVVAPAAHPLAAGSSVNFGGTLDHFHVGLPEGTGLHSFLVQRAAESGKPLRQRIQVGSFEAACRLVAEGVGLGVMPRSVAARHARELPVRVLSLDDSWSVRRLQLCARSFDQLPGFAQESLALLGEIEKRGRARAALVGA